MPMVIFIASHPTITSIQSHPRSSKALTGEWSSLMVAVGSGGGCDECVLVDDVFAAVGGTTSYDGGGGW
ncbi:hypothetical protein KY284_034455 [Solanum tuberosum]|nr:hypothetical protein KY284_034455 [Solanum tuberosum]